MKTLPILLLVFLTACATPTPDPSTVQPDAKLVLERADTAIKAAFDWLNMLNKWHYDHRPGGPVIGKLKADAWNAVENSIQRRDAFAKRPTFAASDRVYAALTELDKKVENINQFLIKSRP